MGFDMSSLGMDQLAHLPGFIRSRPLKPSPEFPGSLDIVLYCYNLIPGFYLIGFHKYLLIFPLDTAGQFIRAN